MIEEEKKLYLNWPFKIFPYAESTFIKLLESPIPATATATASSQKAHFDNIWGTKRGTIDPLVSKRPEKILNK